MPDNPEQNIDSKAETAASEDSSNSNALGDLVTLTQGDDSLDSSTTSTQIQAETESLEGLPTLEIKDGHSESSIMDSKSDGLTGEKREEYFSRRFREITGQDSVIKEGPEKELNNWADSWRDFVESAEVPEGPFRDLVQEVGSQMISGEFDQKELGKKLGAVKDTEEVNQALEELNDYPLNRYGVNLQLDFDAKGNLASLEFQDVNKNNEPLARLKVTANGVVSASGVDQEGKPVSEEEAAKQVALKASPLACP